VTATPASLGTIEAWIDAAGPPGDTPHDGLSLPLVYFAASITED
jgi:hypothetical protein